ncbi:MAG TPA: MFS transporter [Hyphomicrobiaceae bacterium]|nr:MFS transporter [Hyphomicrobiaceae bacterium]
MKSTGRSRAIAIIAVAEVLTLALWFSATAVVPSLRATGAISALQQSLFTSAVQLGFGAGSVASAMLGLADRLEPRRFFAASALVGAIANGLVAMLDPSSPMVILLRFITGATLAGIYPVGMKLAASWAGATGRQDMGFLVGLLVGALTLGSASPHLFNAFGFHSWQAMMIAASLSATLGAGLILAAEVGPRFSKGGAFRRDLVGQALADRPTRLAILGYLGHMWELYAMWAWIGAFLAASFAAGLAPANPQRSAALATFAVIGIGAIGCFGAGWLADRIGRTAVTSIAMGVSGACCLVVGLLFDGPLVLLLMLLMVWGVAIVADSAQFSTAVAELTEPAVVGSVLTLQTASGFLLTLVTIHMMPYAVSWLSWRWAFATLAIGPFLGVVAMLRLRSRPEARRLAGGRR